MGSAKFEARIKSAESEVIAKISEISEDLASASQHLFRSMRGKFISLYTSYQEEDYERSASIFEEIRESKLVRAIAATLNGIGRVVNEVSKFLRTQLGPFIELVFGASLVSILPVAGGTAVGAFVGVGAGLGFLLGTALVLLGIIIMFHALSKSTNVQAME